MGDTKRLMKKLYKKMVTRWKFEHCVMPTNARERRDELCKKGYEAIVCVNGNAYGVKYRMID